VRHTFRYLSLVVLLGLRCGFANAQSEFNVALGFGAVRLPKPGMY